MDPTFSIVIPTYNQADFLKVALDSVLAQTFQDFEVVVVNNYSTDHTLDVVRQAADERVVVIDFQNDGVIGAGRNTGIKASQGEYVAFLDSDDTWSSNKLEEVAAAIKEDPQAGLFCHDQSFMRQGRESGRSYYGPGPGFKGNLYDYLLLVSNIPSTSATVVSRKYLDQVGNFSEDHRFNTVEDYDLWLKLAKVCPFSFMHQALGTHNYHTKSASANVQLHLQNTIALLDTHFGEASEADRPYPKGAVRRRYAYAYYGAAREYHRLGMIRDSLVHFLRTLKTHPFYPKAYAAMGLLLVGVLAKPTRILGNHGSTQRYGSQRNAV